MESLNKLYKKSCKPKCERYTQISNHITLIDNFFEDFDKARNFFINREKWECIAYQDHDKPGHESFFPFWIGKSLIEKYILDNNIVINDINFYDILCNFYYNESTQLNSIFNSDCFPHIDNILSNDVLNYICLINLNKVSITTKFYTYKKKEYCSNEMKDEWNDYGKKITKELIEYYDKNNITREELKEFLNQKKNLDIKLNRKIEYSPNQAIIYPANLFHSPNLTEEFTKDNPRIVLRISFDRKIISHIKPKNINYG